ncbi:hypothetical protein RIR_jg8021.t1 [Rhizophagus irregularis DAOM 181602=DAOM 197198]|nr:hypothetical protein RIR_jg8021.t1 [Rhizophagus irregularis DAOM 181602=DAOM 197198]
MYKAQKKKFHLISKLLNLNSIFAEQQQYSNGTRIFLFHITHFEKIPICCCNDYEQGTAYINYEKKKNILNEIFGLTLPIECLIMHVVPE